MTEPSNTPSIPHSWFALVDIAFTGHKPIIAKEVIQQNIIRTEDNANTRMQFPVRSGLNSPAKERDEADHKVITADRARSKYDPNSAYM
ncbi:hypothetical protein TWF173_000325 [Orbilia oligospora]|nr:hypothetical protein TWF173_000325 [Orbilia oligospora]